MTCKTSRLHNQGGQIIVEYILMMVVVLTISFMLQQYLKKEKFIQNFTVQPWAILSGMVECGVWTKCGIDTPATVHPNARYRVLSRDTKVGD